jgi:uncharacterized protein
MKLPTVMITGGSAGIGATYADRFAERGHDLILVSNEPERLALLADQLIARDGIDVQWMSADLTAEDDLLKVEARIREDDRIGVLINNAGMSLPGTTISNSRERLRTLIALNATQVALLSATAGAVFSARGSGSIVNIASVLGFASAPQIAPAIYSGSKAFVVMFTQSLAAELADTGVYVQCVLPAATRTEIWGKSGMSPDQVPGMIDAHELVDAALLGFDRKETITIPALLDEKLWTTYERAREALIPPTLEGRLADRYKRLAAAE